jgi:hypothetical protein
MMTQTDKWMNRLIISLSLLLIMIIHRMILIISYTLYICFYSAEFRITFLVYLKFLPIGKNLGERSEPDIPCYTHPLESERPKGAKEAESREQKAHRIFIFLLHLFQFIEDCFLSLTARHLSGVNTIICPNICIPTFQGSDRPRKCIH